ncbi:putative transposase [Alcanivorax sp. NBRC 101098]|nr:putative transposase [Alcanivorax sp. NBRC 101098]
MIDDYNLEGLGIEADLSLPSVWLIWPLAPAIEWRGKPAALCCDNGPEYIPRALVEWATEKRITLI